MNHTDLEKMFREACPLGFSNQNLNDVSFADGQSMAIIHPASDVKLNIHKKAMSIPKLSWIPLSDEQMSTSFDWVAYFDGTGQGKLVVVLGVGNPYSHPQSPSLPMKQGKVAAVPISIAKVMR